MSDLDWIGLEADQLHLRMPERSEQFYRADRERFKSIFEASLRPSLERGLMTDADREMTLRGEWQAYERAITRANMHRMAMRIASNTKRTSKPIYKHKCETDPATFREALDRFFFRFLSMDEPWLTGWKLIEAIEYGAMIAVEVRVPNFADVIIGEIDCTPKSSSKMLVTVWPYEFGDDGDHDLSAAPIVFDRLAEFLCELYGGKKRPDLPQVTKAQGFDILNAYERLYYENERPTREKVAAHLERHNDIPPDRGTVADRIKAMLNNSYWKGEIAKRVADAKFSEGYFR